jgi:ring-1,2-phenylacetyl-CoA epoxidase subunit PaaE
MEVNYSLEEWETKAGFVLACQARPTTATLALDFDAL